MWVPVYTGDTALGLPGIVYPCVYRYLCTVARRFERRTSPYWFKNIGVKKNTRDPVFIPRTSIFVSILEDPV